MTRENAHKWVILFEAIADGKTLQRYWVSSPGNEWKDDAHPCLDDDPMIYRIKPEPREFWLVLADGPGSRIIKGLYKKPDDGLTPDSSIIHVREVL